VKLVVNETRRQLLKERYEAGLIQALHSPKDCQGDFFCGGYYCLMGAMLTDKEIKERIHSGQAIRVIFNISEGITDKEVDHIFKEMYSLHDPYGYAHPSIQQDKTPLVETIETIINTGTLEI
jgi:hypothetical protein